MPLKTIGTIAIPGAAGSEFDHAAFDPRSRRVFIAHTARDCVEGGQASGHPQAPAAGALGHDGASRRLDDPPCDREAEPAPFPGFPG